MSVVPQYRTLHQGACPSCVSSDSVVTAFLQHACEMETASELSEDVLRVWQTSGSLLAAIPQKEATQKLQDVRSLKRHLQGLCGLPRFRQRLLHEDTPLEDENKLLSQRLPTDLQLVLLSFASVSGRQRDDLTNAAAFGRASEAW